MMTTAARQRATTDATVAILLAMRSADNNSGGKTTSGNAMAAAARRPSRWLDGGAALRRLSGVRRELVTTARRSGGGGARDGTAWSNGAVARCRADRSRRDNNDGQGVMTSTKLDDAMYSNGFWIGDLHCRPWSALTLRDWLGGPRGLRTAQTSSHRKRKTMKHHVVKRAHNVRAKEVDEDNSRVGEAPEKELSLACVEVRESDSERVESSGEEDQDVNGVQSDKTNRGKRVIGSTVSAKTDNANIVRGKTVSAKKISGKIVSNKKDVPKKVRGKKKVEPPEEDMSTPFPSGPSDRSLLLSIKDHVVAAICRNEVKLCFQFGIVFMLSLVIKLYY
ncbi:hypothetical protein Scep_025505 [Stephania cephalantha]|uniref:Uncharacterized protein n=1 Tax=Stephania cephalantha TaxID=152367 RepID=A0AAP0HRM4_9MAGN